MDFSFALMSLKTALEAEIIADRNGGRAASIRGVSRPTWTLGAIGLAIAALAVASRRGGRTTGFLRAIPQRPNMTTLVRCFRRLAGSHHRSSWSWKSRWLANRRPASKLPWKESVGALEGALGLVIAGGEDHPANGELPAEGEEGLGRSAARRDRAFAVPDEISR